MDQEGAIGTNKPLSGAKVRRKGSAADVPPVVSNYFDWERPEKLVEKYAFVNGAARRLDQRMYSCDIVARSIDEQLRE